MPHAELSYVRNWHLADMQRAPINVRFWG
jgi:hypothetical protein